MRRVYIHPYGESMKILWTLALAVITIASISGCIGTTPVDPISIQEVQATVTPEPTPTAAPTPEPTLAPVAPVSVPVPTKTLVAVKSTAPPVTVPVAPAPVQPPIVPSAPPTVAPPAPDDPFAEWLKHPTFTCEPGRAPGWLNENGIPTSCVAN